jgi:thiol-disulfide isomerase/thioredoxin
MRLLNGLGACLLVCAGLSAPTEAKPPEVDEIAPPFTLTMVDGTNIDLEALRGQVVVINFWATWCVPCRKELPLLNAYYKINKPHGLRVFAITTQDSVPISRLRRLFEMLDIPSAAKIKGPYAPLTGVPTNFVIDRAGRVRYAKSGSFDLDALNTIIVPLLNEPAPEQTVAAK